MGTKAVQQGVAEPEAGLGLGAFFAATLVFAGMLTVQYERSWTAAEGLYWK